MSTLTSGQLLCGGLFSSDVLSNWFSSVALMHALIENPIQKEQLLRVLLATNIGSSPVSLLHQCTLLLQQTTKLKAKVCSIFLTLVFATNKIVQWKRLYYILFIAVVTLNVCSKGHKLTGITVTHSGYRLTVKTFIQPESRVSAIWPNEISLISGHFFIIIISAEIHPVDWLLTDWRILVFPKVI